MTQSIRSRLLYLLLPTIITLFTGVSPSRADDWIGGGGVPLSAVEPMTTYEGGAIRVMLVNPLNVPYCGNSSGQASILHVVYTNGTQESRSALVAALYMALAQGKTVTFLLSSASCSPDGSPVIVGMHVSS